MSQQAVMAANTDKRLPCSCETYRAEPKDNNEVFVEDLIYNLYAKYF